MTAPNTFAEFWPHYLRAHRNPTSRLLHYLGTFGGFTLLAVALLSANPWWLCAGTVFAYGCAWLGHFTIEDNVPLAFSRPLWSMLADYRMFALAMAGRLAPHLAAAHALTNHPA
jgi:hypothetical protein